MFRYSGIKQQSLEYLTKTYEHNCANMKVGRCNFLYFYWSVTKFETKTSYNKLFGDIFIYHTVI